MPRIPREGKDKDSKNGGEDAASEWLPDEEAFAGDQPENCAAGSLVAGRIG